MHVLVPPFIVEKLSRGSLAGQFQGIAMFIDISGFTTMTESLMEKGKEGAEVLSLILDENFSAIIETVHEEGGFIASFAGDAMLAIFPHEEHGPTARAALGIQEQFVQRGRQGTSFGSFDLSVKIGIAAGTITWGIVGSQGNRTYYFRGEAVLNCARAEKVCPAGAIMIHGAMKESLGEEAEVKSHSGFWHLLDWRGSDLSPGLKEPPVDEVLMEEFFPRSILQYGQRGEFRDVVNVFLSFPQDLETGALLPMLDGLLKQIKAFGGTLNLLDFGDKGGLMFILFGAPVAYENNLERALTFAHERIRAEKMPMAMGITLGTVYAGLVGGEERKTYTVLGDPVNTAARLMMKAAPGEIFTSEEVGRSMEHAFETRSRGLYTLKGKDQPYSVVEVLKPRQERQAYQTSGVMLGREAEREELLTYLQPLQEKAYGGVVFLYGEAGVGKSRLLHSLEHTVSMAILETDAVMQKSFNPFTFFLKEWFLDNTPSGDARVFRHRYREFLDSLSVLEDERIPKIQKELERVESIVAALLGLHWPDSLYEELDPKRRIENTMFALKELFKARSLQEPLLVVLENAQWLDAVSKETLTVLTRRMEGFPLLFLVVSRYDDDGSKPSFTVDPSVPQGELAIEGLDPTLIPRFLEETLHMPAGEELQTFIAQKTQGNPFYMEQICLYLQEHDLLRAQDGYYGLQKDSVEIPTGIKSIIMARLDRLSEELKQGVQTACILGREFDIQVFSSMLQGKEERSLLDKGVHENIWSPLSQFLYMFHHALLRDAAYDMQLKERLRNLHALAALAMEELYREDPTFFADLGHHFEQAQNTPRALLYLEKAGEYARDQYKNEEALDLFRRALEQIDEDPGRECSIHDACGQILQLTGAWEEAETVFTDNLVLARSCANPLLLGKSSLSLGMFLLGKGELERADDLLQSALPLYEDGEDKRGVIRVLAGLGDVAMARGDREKAMIRYEEELSLAQELNCEEEISQALGRLGNAYREQGAYDKAMDFYKRKGEICKETGDRLGLSQAYNNMGTVYQRQGNYEQAMACFEKDLAICEELGDKRGKGVVLGNMGILKWHLGQQDEVMDWFQAHLHISEELGDQEGISRAIGNMGVVYEHQGEFRQAMACHEQKMRLSREMGRKKGICLAWANIGRLLNMEGEYSRAQETFQKALDLAQELGDSFLISYACFYLGRLAHERGERDGAMPLYTRAIELAEGLGIKYELSEYLYWKGVLLLDHDQHDEAREMADKAYQMAGEVSRQDILYRAGLLQARIEGLQATQEARERMEVMLKSASSSEEKALGYANLYDLTGEDGYRRQAHEEYKRLYTQMPRAEYRREMERLKQS